MEQKDLKRVMERIQMLIWENKSELTQENLSEFTRTWNKGWGAAAQQIYDMLEPYLK